MAVTPESKSLVSCARPGHSASGGRAGDQRQQQLSEGASISGSGSAVCRNRLSKRGSGGRVGRWGCPPARLSRHVPPEWVRRDVQRQQEEEQRESEEQACPCTPALGGDAAAGHGDSARGAIGLG